MNIKIDESIWKEAMGKIERRAELAGLIDNAQSWNVDSLVSERQNIDDWLADTFMGLVEKQVSQDEPEPEMTEQERRLAEIERSKAALLETLHELDRRSIHYKVKLQPDMALRFARQAQPHGVSAADLAELIQDIDAHLPVKHYDYPKDNPNNGQPVHEYWLGKEYSRALYVDVNGAYIPAGYDYAALESWMSQLSRSYGAEEFSVEDRHEIHPGQWFVTFRIWWD